MQLHPGMTIVTKKTLTLVKFRRINDPASGHGVDLMLSTCIVPENSILLVTPDPDPPSETTWKGLGCRHVLWNEQCWTLHRTNVTPEYLKEV